MQVQKFSHDDKEYEIRVVSDGDAVYVKAFRDNRPANRFRYSATIEVIQDISGLMGTDAVKHLIEIAKQDVINGVK